MTIESTPNRAPGFSRRTALKAAAWSVPVVAAATAVPAYAASGDPVDLAVEWMIFGESISGQSPDGLRTYSLGVSGGVTIANAGPGDLPAGALFVVSFDSRILRGPTPTVEGAPLTPAGSSTTGNVTTATFLLPALPAGGAPLQVENAFAPFHDPANAPWYEDVQPYTVTVTPVGTTDSNPANNTVTSPARYVDTVDAAIAVVWGEREIPSNAGATPYVVDVPQTITVESFVPGGTSNEISISVAGPLVWSADVEGNWTPAYTAATVVSALLDGVDVSSDVQQEGPRVGNIWLRNTSMAAGQKLVLTLDVAVHSGPIGGVTANGGAYAQAGLYPDRDQSNDRVESPRYSVN